jgi:alpha-glucosidase
MRITGPRPTLSILATTLLCVAGSASAYGQTLAHKNWAGSGVTVEPWWRRAVFYRIDPAKFQDSDGDGAGDLAGIGQRLDYLQNLGVDALLLDSSSSQPSGLLPAQGFDDLVRQATGHHLRLIVALGAPASQAPASDADYLAQARLWLNQGAAGLYVPISELQKVDGATHIGLLLHQLRLMTNSFPGDRILIAATPTPADLDVWRAAEKEAQLTASPRIATASPTASSLRAQLETALAGPPAGVVLTGTRRGAAPSVDPLLQAARVPAQQDTSAEDRLQRTLAAMLLASRSAVILEYGQELGLATAHGQPALMQWTPTNVTPKPLPPPEPRPETPPAPSPSDYGTYRPYVPPPPTKLPPPKVPPIIVSDDPQPAVIDPNSLPGFTAIAVDASLLASNGSTANVAIEQADPKSLLNFYRQLIQLHHDNAAIRNGAQTIMNHDAEEALVWVRKAPPGSKSPASVVVVCRLGTTPIADEGLKVVRDLVSFSGDVVFIAEGH